MPPHRANLAAISIAALLLCAACAKQEPSASPTAAGAPGYAPPTSCAGCHAEIARQYKSTGMARAFVDARPEALIERLDAPPFLHEPSGRYYQLQQRSGRLFQVSWNAAPPPAEPHPIEREVHFIMGSGNHARTYLHRTPAGKLIELPLGWYAQSGGAFAMSPGYDRRDHPGFTRAIPDECMFCHNGYPSLPAHSRAHGADATFPATLPQGIDCQRCHGPGQAHVAAASSNRPADEIRRHILNPKRLSAQRQLEVCMQCHLESTSRALPYAIVRFPREPFSYRPQEPLAHFILHFDYAPNRGPADHFEIAHAAYRLRRSKCFTAAPGRMVCTTCHNPHEPARSPAAEARYTAACRSCHPATHPNDPRRSTACSTCHMPRRRTDDVVHAVMTDHLIQRRPPARNLLAPIAEVHESQQTAYRGPVVLSYPPTLSGRDGELYLATAQVHSAANLTAGIAQLRSALERHSPPEPEFYHQLAEALYRTSNDTEAILWYRKALERDPAYLPAIRNLGATLTRMGRFAEADEVLRRAPRDAVALNNLGESLLQQGSASAAAASLRASLALDPDSPDAHNNLGRALARLGGATAAHAAWQSALQLKPGFAPAHMNLAASRDASGDWPQARSQYEQALLDPGYALARFNYGTALAARGQTARAEDLLVEAVRLDPTLAEAHLNLGNLHAMRGQPALAVADFTRALAAQPGFARARLNLSLALLELGRRDEALGHLRQAAAPGNEVRPLALRVLQQLGVP